MPESPAILRSFTARYLGFLGAALADTIASTADTSSVDALKRVLDGAEGAGCDEFIVVPGTTDLRCLDVVAEVVQSRL